jgi:predicted CoA-substrate-specific enzyme activase
MITLGIDVGSVTTKSAIIRDGVIIGETLVLTGHNPEKAGRTVYEALLAAAGVSAATVDAVVATGYGRQRIGFAGRMITEITCHAVGAHYLNPSVRTVIDIGGQDSKAIAVDARGQVKDFVMNDKCAAGTGRFLDVMARALEVDLGLFDELSQTADRPSAISSLCTVFAESEVISLIAGGESRENIIAGIHEAIASRVAALAGRIGIQAPVMMTGGVSKNAGVVRALQNKIGGPIEVTGKAQLAGAIGAAILAQRR